MPIHIIRRWPNTLNTFNMNVRYEVGRFRASKQDTMMLFGLRLLLKFPRFGPHLHRCNCVRVHPCAHPHHKKLPKHFAYIQCGCEIQIWGFTASNHDTTMLFGLHLNLNFPTFGSHLHGCNSVTVYPYAPPQDMKVPKHFVYIQCGCMIQNGMV